MPKTVIKFGDPKAQKKWSGSLFLDTVKKSYFDRKFVSEDDNAVIQRLTDLESDAGDTITFDLSVQLRQKPVTGDNRLQGKEENLRFFSDEIYIDQMRHGVSAGGKMSRKRTLHNIRKVARDRLSDYWSKYVDEMNFIYLSGARGINEDFTEDTAWVGHGGNPIEAPDGTHLMYGGAANSKASIVAGSTMSRAIIERATVKARMMRSKDPTTANMLPVMINGEGHYVCIMSPFQEHDMRTSAGSDWLDIQKAAAASEGRNNPIFKGGLGMVNNVVLHSHESAIRFNDYGAGNNVEAARALFLGRQAGVVAYGSSSGLRFAWTEETTDHGNEPTIASGVILGVKKTRFNNKDFGVISIDTAAKDPNAA
ncbi:N4-gp56 family major capsid protein [Aminobacter sp. MDW-2]|uniref:N4-gp56 family major capsid protein n=1 Tax=Aminobacter sp. MDW-2 TaxID=2666139 RepID=UPI0012AF5840|nr:N4-gp56 family major capsid protein [Aminobacter sp. MDW-2]MRX32813.1 N4-gp56 family major capsid protein [Aminobacter sp. MDW-2]QNH34528.1 N4-gp56 family major capsid protein [Aminobacter sp. MDW-2]